MKYLPLIIAIAIITRLLAWYCNNKQNKKQNQQPSS